jgi:membrane associated rhomboid family serine protease
VSEAQPEPFPQPSPEELERQRLRQMVREAVERSDYGFFDERPVTASREELMDRMRQGRPTPLVWTPETIGLVPPWQIPWLFDAYREHGARRARNLALFWGGVLALLVLATAVTGTIGFGNPLLLFALFAGLLAAQSLREMRTFRALTVDRLRAEVREVRARPAPRREPVRETRWIGVGLIALFVIQVLPAFAYGLDVIGTLLMTVPTPTTEVVNVNRELVRLGQPWRLLTGTLVHGGILHIVFNFMALTALGRVLEAFAHRAYVPLVFLLSAIGGSVASVALMPSGPPSVGASGGILGLFGFLGVMAIRRRRLMPPGFGRALLVDVSVIALMGIVGYGFIDNAAHAGGLAAGALIGLVSVPTTGDVPHWEAPRAVRALSSAALAVLLLATLATALMMASTYLG